MNKQTFSIPEGCKAITMEQVGNQIITTFEPEFKRGDVIYCEDKGGFNWVFILKEKINRESNPYTYFCSFTLTGMIKMDDYCRHPDFIFRLATPEETQLLWDALAKKGKRWNPETMQVEEIKKEIPRAKCDNPYYYVSRNFKILLDTDIDHSIDSTQYKCKNYFLTEEQAQRAAKRIEQALSDFWKEELK